MQEQRGLTVRRIGEFKRADIQYRMRPGAYAIAFREGKVMLVEEHSADENLQLPGGGIDPGESPTMALHRELMEETGWRATNLRKLGAFRRFPYMAELGFWADKVCHIYLVHPARQLGAPSEPGHTVHWLAPEDALSALGVEGYRHFLALALRRS